MEKDTSLFIQKDMVSFVKWSSFLEQFLKKMLERFDTLDPALAGTTLLDPRARVAKRIVAK